VNTLRYKLVVELKKSRRQGVKEREICWVKNCGALSFFCLLGEDNSHQHNQKQDRGGRAVWLIKKREKTQKIK
jgi:hypothetical protein